VPDELPPPVVTISDPNHPGAVGDVIGGGSEHDPWKPSRTVVRRGLLALLVLAAAAVPVTVVKVRDHQRELDARAVAELKLTQFGNEGGEVTDNGVVPFSLFNGGKDAVRVLSAHIDREGYPTQKVDVTIEHGSAGKLDVALPSPCPGQVSPFSQPRLLILTVRTHRGTVVTKSVPVGDEFGFTYQESLRSTCGFLSPSEALDARVEQQTERPRALDLHVSITNRARTTFDIKQVLTFPGLAAEDVFLPHHLQGRSANSTSFEAFTVTLTVTDCLRAKQSTKVDLTSDYVAPGLTFLTSGGAAEVFFDPDVQTAITKLVARSCP
jgi:hypothetical protein